MEGVHFITYKNTTLIIELPKCRLYMLHKSDKRYGNTNRCTHPHARRRLGLADWGRASGRGGAGARRSLLADGAGDAEELDELEDEAHHEEPRVARHLRARDQQAPEEHQQDRVERVAQVAQPANRRDAVQPTAARGQAGGSSLTDHLKAT